MWFSLSQTGQACAASERPPNGEVREVKLYSNQTVQSRLWTRMKLTQKILLNLIILILTCCYCKILLLICCGDSCVDSHTSGPVDKARKQGILAGGSWATLKDSVESIPPRQKRTDNEKRKSDSHEETTVVNISYDETGEPCVDSHTCEEPVESNPPGGVQTTSRVC